MSVWDKQHGGSHYQKFKIQPSKFVVEIFPVPIISTLALLIGKPVALFVTFPDRKDACWKFL